VSGFAIGLGVLLAIFGPVLLIPLIWIIYRIGTKRLARRIVGSEAPATKARLLGLCSAAAVVGGVLAASYIPGKISFERLCDEEGVPVIHRRTRTDGYFRTSIFPYEAQSILAQGPFRFVEGPDPYKQGSYVSYESDPDGPVQERDVDAPTADYEVEKEFEQAAWGILVTRKTIRDRRSGEELAKAANITYQGGPLSLFFGTHAMDSCPDVRSPDGSTNFETFYNLERIVLAR
jgi:hypothetical protein